MPGLLSAAIVTRRDLLHVIAAGAAIALLAACGREPSSTARARSASPTPAPTRAIPLPMPSPGVPTATVTPAPAGPVAYVWKAEHGLLRPGHLALDGHGNLYVTDDENQRVVKFDENGQFVLAWGARGMGDGQFRFRSAHQDHSPIAGIAVDGQGAVYVADSTSRVQIFDPDGNYLRQWSAEGAPASLPTIPSGLTIDAEGNVYVVDTGNQRIQRFTAAGRFVAKWGSRGAGDNEMQDPTDVAADASGNLYVVDDSNNRVLKFRPR